MSEKKSSKNQKFRTMLRDMEASETKQLDYDPKKMTLSSMRTTASALGVDMGRKYSVSRTGDTITIARIY